MRYLVVFILLFSCVCFQILDSGIPRSVRPGLQAAVCD